MSKKLLLADDSVTIQKVVNLTFADEGIEVITVADGNHAFEEISRTHPDLVMADVNMPGLNGYDLCERIKQDGDLNQTPVILLVGSFEPFDEAEARRVGADDFLTKPFQSIRQLVSKVSNLLGTDREEEADAADSEQSSYPLPANVPDFAYSDAPADDEMIETASAAGDVSAVSAYDETQKFESNDYHEETEYDLAKTQPLSAEDLPELTSVAAVTATEEKNEIYARDDYSNAQMAPPPQNVGYDAPVDSDSDDTGNDRIDNEDLNDMQATEKAVENSTVEAPTEENSATDRESILESESADEIPQPQSVSLLETDDDDDDLLELPPLDEDEIDDESEDAEAAGFITPVGRYELPNRDVPAQTESAAATTAAASVVTETAEQTPMPAAPAAQNSENADRNSDAVAQFPPELIDAIVRRVIEQLSAQNISDIKRENIGRQIDGNVGSIEEKPQE